MPRAKHSSLHRINPRAGRFGSAATQAARATKVPRQRKKLHVAQARKEITLALEVLEKGGDARQAMSAEVLAACIQARSADSSSTRAAIEDLEALGQRAKKAGFVEQELEVQLALGDIELAGGNAEGRERLARLERLAQTKGYRLTTHKAAQRGSALRATH